MVWVPSVVGAACGCRCGHFKGKICARPLWITWGFLTVAVLSGHFEWLLMYWAAQQDQLSEDGRVPELGAAKADLTW